MLTSLFPSLSLLSSPSLCHNTPLFGLILFHSDNWCSFATKLAKVKRIYHTIQFKHDSNQSTATLHANHFTLPFVGLLKNFEAIKHSHGKGRLPESYKTGTALTVGILY